MASTQMELLQAKTSIGACKYYNIILIKIKGEIKMKLFNHSKKQKTLAEFKTSAACIDKTDAIIAITCGTLHSNHVFGKNVASIGSIAL
ncbi:MAG: hypothetical protein KAH20_11145 [Methylococcales bacterium]|nr:hypothetical protein [Methylococcales bacterium]